MKAGVAGLEGYQADGLALTVLQTLCLFSVRSLPAEDPAQRGDITYFLKA